MDKKEYNFDGYDWLELAEYFGFPNEIEAATFENFLRNVAFYDNNEDANKREYKEKVVNACRAYLDALIERNILMGTDEAQPLWEGLLDIHDDTTFLTYYGHLVSCMWA